MAKRIDTVLSAALTFSAVVVAVSVGFRTFAQTGEETTEPDLIEYWEEALPLGFHMAGDTAAPVTILQFADLQCPACRGFHYTALQVLEKRPNDVNLVYVNFPLPYHEYAEGAALAAECAAETGAFGRWIHAVYEKQDSLGLKSWKSYARDAGIADTAFIQACAEAGTPSDRLNASLDFGSRIELDGTPTVLVNGWRYPYTPTLEDLNLAVEAVLSGERPRDYRKIE